MRLIDYRASDEEFAGRALLITGAGGGLGRAASLALAARGAHLVLLGRDAAKLQSVADEIAAAGGEALVTPLDLATAGEAAVVELGETLRRRFGKLDGLLHNAALLGAMRPVAQTPAEDWHRVMQVNVNAAFMLTRELIPMLEAAPEAATLFTTSGAAHQPPAYWGAYSASKFAVRGLMLTLAKELGRVTNIRINALDPGAVDTAMRRRAFPGENPGRNPPPEALAGCYLYLLGPASLGVNGREFQPESEI